MCYSVGQILKFKKSFHAIFAQCSLSSLSTSEKWDDYFQSQIAKKKSLNIKSKLVQSMQASTWLSNIAFYLQPIGLQTLGVINSESCYCLQAFAHSHLKLLTPGLTCCAVSLESEQTPFSFTGHQFRPAVLHWSQLGTGWIVQVPMSYFYSETNEWSKDWVKLWALLWLVTISGKLKWKSISCHWQKITKHQNLFLQAFDSKPTQLRLSQHSCYYSKSGSMFSSSEPVAAYSDCSQLENCPVLMLANLPKLSRWLNFFPQFQSTFAFFFVQIAQMGLILPRWGLNLPRIPPPTPVL